jgi:DNA sulfur modification protein DndD
VKILVEDLDSLSRKYEKELGELQGISTEVAHFAKGLRKVREEIDEYERTISGLQLEIQTFKNDKEKLEAHRDRYKDIPEVTKKIQDLNEKRQSINSKVTKSKTLLDDHADSLFGVFLTKDLQKLIESNEKRIARLETASGLKKEDIEKLETREQILKRSIPTCDICGHTLTKEEVIELKKNTKAVKDKIESMSKYKKEINGLAYQNRVYKAFMKDYPFDFVAQLDEFYENVEKLRDANKEYDNLSEKMQGKEYGDFGKLNSEISELDKKIGRKEDEIDEKGEKKKEKENERDEIVRSIKCTGHDDKTLNTTAGLTDLSRRLRNNLGMILTSGTRLKRGKILEEANRIFKEITNKPDEHKGLEFEDDDSYSFVIRKYDGEIVKNPSKGEKQVLAISFLLGLNQYTGINNIILMDTPVASLDPIHSARVGNALSKLDNQVIFLAQPTELSGDMYKNMKTGIAKEFEIERKEIKKGSYASFFKEV